MDKIDTVDIRFTPEGFSASAYGENMQLLDEAWFTWDEIEELKTDEESHVTFQSRDVETGRYTAEVEYDDGCTLHVTRGDATPEVVREDAVKMVPDTSNIWRVGIWRGGIADRPETGHENGLLEESDD